MITDLYNVNPSDLDLTTSTYDYNEHLPFPTLEHIRKETAVDMVQGTGSTDVAKATVRYLTKLTANIIYDTIALESRNKLEFLIAKSERHRKAFIDTVCAMVLTTRGDGIAELLKSGRLNKNDLSKVVQAYGSILFINLYNFTLPDDVIRSDY